LTKFRFAIRKSNTLRLIIIIIIRGLTLHQNNKTVKAQCCVQLFRTSSQQFSLIKCTEQRGLKKHQWNIFKTRRKLLPASNRSEQTSTKHLEFKLQLHVQNV